MTMTDPMEKIRAAVRLAASLDERQAAVDDVSEKMEKIHNWLAAQNTETPPPALADAAARATARLMRASADALSEVLAAVRCDIAQEKEGVLALAGTASDFDHGVLVYRARGISDEARADLHEAIDEIHAALSRAIVVLIEPAAVVDDDASEKRAPTIPHKRHTTIH